MEPKREYKRAFFGRVRKMLIECDIALEVVDARDISGTRVRKLDVAFADKVIIVAAKSDIFHGTLPTHADSIPIIAFSSRVGKGVRRVLQALDDKKAAIDARRKKHGKLPMVQMKVGVFGIPNVGKSTLINVLSGRHGARTGFKAGVTVGPQWMTLRNGFLLCDTPGVVPLHAGDEGLALKAALDVEKLHDPEETALRLIDAAISSKNPSIFAAYGISEYENANDALEAIAKRRGMLLAGGELNLKEASKVIIREYQKGKFEIRKEE
jgi:ribosome biogenesis GTPase A